MKQTLLIIAGPTAVGKSDAALAIAKNIPAEIVNADVGQFYEPLTIGTAKPNWKELSVKHHLFDLVAEEPRAVTVWEYRQLLIAVAKEIWNKNKLPIIVGGSSFYIQSLLFPVQAQDIPVDGSFDTAATKVLWEQLHQSDPERAQQIHPNDRYRIVRALQILKAGRVPSEMRPDYAPPAPFHLIIMMRDRKELFDRIDARVVTMIKSGWIEEVECLLDTPWERFVLEKKIIGYDDIVAYLRQPEQERDKKKMIATVQQKTRKYAKRQITFLRGMKEKIESAQAPGSGHQFYGIISECNLTLTDLDLYIERLVDQLKPLFPC